jgi:hypothetical protein
MDSMACPFSGACPGWAGLLRVARLDDIFLFRDKIPLFRHNRFSTLFFSMKVAESGSLSKLLCRFQRYTSFIMTVQLESQCLQNYDVLLEIFRPNFLRRPSSLQALRFKLNCLNQACISLKSTMQLTKTSFPDSAALIEKKRVKNRLWRKSKFLWRKKIKRSRLAALMV